MKIRDIATMGLIATLLIGVAPVSQAGTFGASGEIEAVDLGNNTIQLGKYTLSVSSSSVMLGRFGRRLRLDELEAEEGPVNVTMYVVGGKYLLRTLNFYDPDEEG